MITGVFRPSSGEVLFDIEYRNGCLQVKGKAFSGKVTLYDTSGNMVFSEETDTSRCQLAAAGRQCAHPFSDVKIDSLPLESGAKRAWKRRIERKYLMIISTKKGTPKEELEKIVDRFEKQGLDVTLITGKDYNVFGLVGDTTKIDERDVLAHPWIDNVTRVSAPYKRANRLFHPADSVIDCGGK